MNKMRYCLAAIATSVAVAPSTSNALLRGGPGSGPKKGDRIGPTRKKRCALKSVPKGSQPERHLQTTPQHNAKKEPESRLSPLGEGEESRLAKMLHSLSQSPREEENNAPHGEKRPLEGRPFTAGEEKKHRKNTSSAQAHTLQELATVSAGTAQQYQAPVLPITLQVPTSSENPPTPTQQGPQPAVGAPLKSTNLLPPKQHAPQIQQASQIRDLTKKDNLTKKPAPRACGVEHGSWVDCAQCGSGAHQRRNNSESGSSNAKRACHAAPPKQAEPAREVLATVRVLESRPVTQAPSEDQDAFLAFVKLMKDAKQQTVSGEGWIRGPAETLVPGPVTNVSGPKNRVRAPVTKQTSASKGPLGRPQTTKSKGLLELQTLKEGRLRMTQQQMRGLKKQAEGRYTHTQQREYELKLVEADKRRRDEEALAKKAFLHEHVSQCRAQRLNRARGVLDVCECEGCRTFAKVVRCDEKFMNDCRRRIRNPDWASDFAQAWKSADAADAAAEDVDIDLEMTKVPACECGRCDPAERKRLWKKANNKEYWGRGTLKRKRGDVVFNAVVDCCTVVPEPATQEEEAESCPADERRIAKTHRALEVLAAYTGPSQASILEEDEV